MKFKKYNRIIFTFLLFVVFLISTVFSQSNIEIEAPKLFTMKAGERVLIPIRIRNLKSTEIRVFLKVFPPYYEGISAYLERNEISVLPNSDVIVNLVISSPKDVFDRIVTYTLYVNYENVAESYRLDVNIIGEKGGISVEDYGINKQYINPEEPFSLFVVYKNSRESTSSVRVRLEIFYGDEVVKFEERFINILRYSYENYTLTHKFSYFDKPGKYHIYVYSFDENDNLLSRLVFEINLREVKEIKKDVERVGSLFSQRIIIRLKNIGNVKQTITLREEIPIIFKPFILFENLQPKIVGDEVIWHLELKPQEEIIISFSILYWVVLAVVSIFVGTVMFYIFFFVLVPKISKKLEFSEDLYKVKIVIKNNTQKKMKNIEISDFVPSLFSIVEFETVKPQIKKTKDGYSLFWKIGDLRPKEELIISYKIRPLIEIIGKIKLPPPKVRYVLR